MNTSPASLFSQLSALGIRPKKGLGQNFLVDPAHRARIVAAAELTRDDTVLEIGPGPGVLTELIAEQAGRVIAVELDDRLIPLLRNRFANQPHVSIVHADILKVDVGALMTMEAGSWKRRTGERRINQSSVSSVSVPATRSSPTSPTTSPRLSSANCWSRRRRRSGWC